MGMLVSFGIFSLLESTVLSHSDKLKNSVLQFPQLLQPSVSSLIDDHT